ncbi:MAG TPA: YicC/YloC family endoribonuclease, partial [Sphingomonadales bacterium]
MTIASMTGFARDEGTDGAVAWVWEVKSVNGKGLDLRCRMPAGYESLELEVRKRVGARISRGSL